MGKSGLTNQELLEIQKKFRRGEIKEKDIPKEQLEDLKELYHKQIDLIEQSIEEDRQKILRIRKKCNL